VHQADKFTKRLANDSLSARPGSVRAMNSKHCNQPSNCSIAKSVQHEQVTAASCSQHEQQSL